MLTRRETLIGATAAGAVLRSGTAWRRHRSQGLP
jgi:hypothetical protein